MRDALAARCSAHGTSFMTPWQPPLLRTRGVIHDALAARCSAHGASWMTPWQPVAPHTGRHEWRPVAPHTGRHEWRPGSPLLRARNVMRDALVARCSAHGTSCVTPLHRPPPSFRGMVVLKLA